MVKSPTNHVDSANLGYPNTGLQHANSNGQVGANGTPKTPISTSTSNTQSTTSSPKPKTRTSYSTPDRPTNSSHHSTPGGMSTASSILYFQSTRDNIASRASNIFFTADSNGMIHFSPKRPNTFASSREKSALIAVISIATPLFTKRPETESNQQVKAEELPKKLAENFRSSLQNIANLPEELCEIFREPINELEKLSQKFETELNLNNLSEEEQIIVTQARHDAICVHCSSILQKTSSEVLSYLNKVDIQLTQATSKKQKYEKIEANLTQLNSEISEDEKYRIAQSYLRNYPFRKFIDDKAKQSEFTSTWYDESQKKEILTTQDLIDYAKRLLTEEKLEDKKVYDSANKELTKLENIVKDFPESDDSLFPDTTKPNDNTSQNKSSSGTIVYSCQFINDGGMLIPKLTAQTDKRPKTSLLKKPNPPTKAAASPEDAQNSDTKQERNSNKKETTEGDHITAYVAILEVLTSTVPATGRYAALPEKVFAMLESVVSPITWHKIRQEISPITTQNGFIRIGRSPEIIEIITDEKRREIVKKLPEDQRKTVNESIKLQQINSAFEAVCMIGNCYINHASKETNISLQKHGKNPPLQESNAINNIRKIAEYFAQKKSIEAIKSYIEERKKDPEKKEIEHLESLLRTVEDNHQKMLTNIRTEEQNGRGEGVEKTSTDKKAKKHDSLNHAISEFDKETTPLANLLGKDIAALFDINYCAARKTLEETQSHPANTEALNALREYTAPEDSTSSEDRTLSFIRDKIEHHIKTCSVLLAPVLLSASNRLNFAELVTTEFLNVLKNRDLLNITDTTTPSPPKAKTQPRINAVTKIIEKYTPSLVDASASKSFAECLGGTLIKNSKEFERLFLGLDKIQQTGSVTPARTTRISQDPETEPKALKPANQFHTTSGASSALKPRSCTPPNPRKTAQGICV